MRLFGDRIAVPVFFCPGCSPGRKGLRVEAAGRSFRPVLEGLGGRTMGPKPQVCVEL